MEFGNFIGFETIGNATLIAYDKKPILVTDPWLNSHAYFGSFVRTNEIPGTQLEAILNCPYVWLSHGHPDHIDAEALERLQGKKILLPDHVGNRIAGTLKAEGFDVHVLKNLEWFKLSDNIRILCVSDYFQDAVLLADINGRLAVNINDAADLGWGNSVKKIIRTFSKVYLLKFFGTGVGDMANFFDEQGNRIVPPSVEKRPVGKQIQFYAELYGATDVIPFSSFHAYQRTDSFWANEYRTSVDELFDGFNDTRCTLHLPFARVDCETDGLINLDPPKLDLVPMDPKEFGDDWNEMLEAEEKRSIVDYFKKIEHLSDGINYIDFVVGGETTRVEIAKKNFRRGITFETPRASLMTAIEHEIFDDILIGNFAKTTVHGNWDSLTLHPYFTPYVAKYADNGRAKSKQEVSAYLKSYRARAPVDFLIHRFEQESERRIRKFVGTSTTVLGLTKKTYLFLKRA